MIPIFNSLYDSENNIIKTDQINLKKLNILNLKKVDTNKFPSIKMINKLENRDSLLETIIVLANDELVNLFLLKKINFTDITYYLQKIINMKEFKKLRFIKPGNIKSIFSLNKLIRLNINNFF
jgi:1-deoxy-D-xylulose-5-phosphate reductoisomerase